MYVKLHYTLYIKLNCHADQYLLLIVLRLSMMNTCSLLFLRASASHNEAIDPGTSEFVILDKTDFTFLLTHMENPAVLL